MSFTTTIEKRADNRIFAGNDPAHTATGVSGITAATPMLTPLMLDDTTGNWWPGTGRRPERRSGFWPLSWTGRKTC